MADEKQQALLEQRAKLEHGTESDHGETGGADGVNQVGVAAGGHADLVRIGRRPDSCRDLRGAEAEGAGGQEGLGLLVGMNEDLERSLLDLFGVKRIGEVVLGQDERTGWKDFGLPVSGERQVDDRLRHGKIR